MKKPSRFSRGEKKMLWCATLGCGALALGAVLSARSHAEPDWNLPPVAVPQNNGYDVYLQAAKMIRWTKPAPDPIDDNDSYNLTPAQKQERYSLARRRAWLDANEVGFAMFERAQKLESCYPTPHADLMPTIPRMRQLARFKVAQANTFALEKRWAEATDAALDDVELGFDMARGGNMIARSAASSIVSIGLLPLESPLVIENLEAEAARNAARRLDELMSVRPTYAEAFKTERWYGVAFWQRTMKNPRWRDKLLRPGCMMTFGDKTKPTAFDKAAANAGYAVVGFGLGVAAPNRTIVDNNHRAFDWIDVNFPKPYGAALDAEPESLDMMTRLYVGAYMGENLESERFQDARELTKLRLIGLRLALQIYRKQHGVYPAALNELKPILANVPLDPFTDGEPFGYRREGVSTRLWSVGPDGRDDGGKPVADPNRLYSSQPFTIWPNSRGDWVATYNR